MAFGVVYPHTPNNRPPSRSNPSQPSSSSAQAPRSNSISRTSSTLSRPFFGHSRGSSGSQTSRHDHETSGRNADHHRPSTSTSGAHSHKLQRHASTRVSSSTQETLEEEPAGRTSLTHASTGTSASLASRPRLSSSTTSSARSINVAHKTVDHRPSQRPQMPDTSYVPFATFDVKHVAGMHYPDPDRSRPPAGRQVNSSLPRTDSASTNGGTGTAASLSTTRTMTSTDPSASSESFASKPFVHRNGRTYINDPNLPYPLPVDLTELHRQSLRTLMLIQVFGAPFCSPDLLNKPPQRVLEIGCGSGFWSMMCHRYFKGKGHSNISFTGIDIAPLAPRSVDPATDSLQPDRQMKWKFVQHDLRQFPWPLPSEEYDLVMVKDTSLISPAALDQTFSEEYIRVLRPGGVLEMWESDHTLRMLRPHSTGVKGAADESEEQEAASRLGAYVMTPQTLLSPPLNPFLVEYNHWITRAFESRQLPPLACPHIGPFFLQEADALGKVTSRRLAIPLSEVRWEREGVGGVVTKDGKSYVEMKSKTVAQQNAEKKSLTPGQAALRRTALLTVVQQIQSLEPLLREVSGKSQDEWDLWLGKMMGDLMSESGTSWGECLEVGAWYAKKKGSARS